MTFNNLRNDLAKENLAQVVLLNVGKTPAELMALVRKARQEARTRGRALAVPDLVAETIGVESADQETTHRIAVHEAGHALACVVFKETPMLRMVSILKNDNNMGRTLTGNLPGVTTRKRIEGLAMVALAGRAAESLVFGDDDPSDGAESDLESATRMLCRLHASLGMGGSLLHFDDPEERLLHDRGFAALIESELARLMAAVIEGLRGRELYILEIADRLCDRRTLFGPDIATIVQAVNQYADAKGYPDEPATAA